MKAIFKTLRYPFSMTLLLMMITGFVKAQSNDNFEDAYTLTSIDNFCSVPGEFSTAGATPDEALPSNWTAGPYTNVWYKFTATTTEVSIRVEVGSMNYPRIALHDATKAEIKSVANAGSIDPVGMSVNTLSIGETYYINISNGPNAGHSGTFILCVDDAVSEDYPAGAITITHSSNNCSADGAYDTRIGTPDGTKPSNWINGPNANVWFTFQAASNEVTLDVKVAGVTQAMKFPRMALYNDAMQILANVGDNGISTDITLNYTGLTVGDWYYVNVDNGPNTGHRGLFTLCIDNPGSTPALPIIPANFSATAISSNQIDLSWDDVSDETSYTLSRSTTSGNGFVTLAENIAANTTSYSDQGLASNTSYFYKIEAINGSGSSGQSVEVSATTDPLPVPSVPSNLMATAVSSSEINLNWTDNANNETGFEIHRSNGSGGPYTFVGTTNANVTTFNDAGLTASTSYYHVVLATNASGASAFSAESTATTDLASPPPSSAVSININFTRIGSGTSSGWNHFASNSNSGSSMTDLVDEQGVGTGIDVALLTNWNNTSATGGMTSGIYPQDVMESYIWTDNVGEIIQFSGLDVEKQYSFEFFSSRDRTGDRRAEFVIGSSTVELNASGNTDNTVRIDNVSPDTEGTIEITVNRPSGSAVAYLNAIVVKTYGTANPTVPNAPSGLVTTSMSSSEITLNWTDNANDETGFEIHRSTTTGGPYSLVATVGSNDINYTDAGLNASTTYYYVIRAINGVGASSYSLEGSASTDTPPVNQTSSRMLINFGQNSAPSPWNNTLSAPSVGTTLSSLVNDQGVNQPIALEVVTANWAGSQSGVFNQGAQTADDSGVYPDAVMSEYWYFGTFGGDATVQMKLTGLNAEATYDLVFFGSSAWTGVADNGTTQYAAGGQTVSVNVQDNTSLTGTITDITPDVNGEIIITMSKAAGTPVGYINAMELIERTQETNEGLVSDAIEIQALRDLYNNTGGTSWTNNTGWPTSAAEWDALTSVGQIAQEAWFGVTVEQGDVTMIRMNANGQESGNNLQDGIPESLTNLTALKSLRLNHNPLLTGSIPLNIGDLDQLDDLWLNDNDLDGVLPSSMSAMTSLKIIKLEGNRLGGQLGNALIGNAGLEELWLNDNQFEGSIPSYFSGFNQLKVFYVLGNNFSGSFPNWFNSLTSLEWLGVEGNFEPGPIPDLFNLTQLQLLAIGNTNRNGLIPDWIGNFSNLWYLGLHNNNLTGTIPASWSGLTSLQTIDLYNVGIDGAIPDFFNTFNELTTLNIYNTFIDGLPGFGAHPNKANLTIRVHDNLLDFGHLVKNFPLGTNPYSEFTYSPQKTPSNLISVNATAGLPFQMENDREHAEENRYEWQEWDGNAWLAVPGANFETFGISDFDASIDGKRYRCAINNNWLTALTIYSSEFRVNYIGDEPPVNYDVQPLYNGTITSMQWRTDRPDGVAEDDFEDNGWGTYLFEYDDQYQLTGALWGTRNGLQISVDNNRYRLNRLAYDPNGNIQSLRRYDGNGGLKHDFEYTYNSDPNATPTNQLERIAGHSSYHYNSIGQLTYEDSEEGEDKYVEYDVTGKVIAVYSQATYDETTGSYVFDDQFKKVSYTYDDRGFRLMKRNEETKKETLYLRDASGNLLSIYERDGNDQDQMGVRTEVPVYGSGKIGVYYPQQDGTTAYELTDHLGNVRAVVKRQLVTLTATMEDTGTPDMTNPRVEELQYFDNLFETAIDDVNRNHTDYTDASYSSFLYWGGTEVTPTQAIGPSTGLRVRADDEISIETYALYDHKGGTYSRDLMLSSLVSQLTSTFTGTIATDAGAMVNDLIDDANTALFNVPGVQNNEDDRPFAFLNYVLFDDGFALVDAGARRVSNQAEGAYEKLTWDQPLNVIQDGYLFVWVSNESNDTQVWFDDLSVTLTRDMTTQSTDYYPFGSVARRYNTPNNYFEPLQPTSGLEESMIARLDLNGNTNDQSGNGNNATLYGGSYANGIDGLASTAVTLDGVDDFMEINPTSWDTDNELSFSFWLKTNNTGTQGLINKMDYIKGVGIMSYLNPSGNVYFVTWIEPFVPIIHLESSESVNDNEWHLINLVLKGTKAEIWIDGHLSVTGNAGGNILITNDEPIEIGQGNNTSYFSGALDEFYIFDRALNAAEITQLYSQKTIEDIDQTTATQNQIAFGQYYRYGFQGEFAEEDSETGWNSFELRMYDAVIGRWLVRDPAFEFPSPYLALGNDPMNLVDPDGSTTRPINNKRRWKGFKNPNNFFKRAWNSISGNQFLNTAYKLIVEHPELDTRYRQSDDFQEVYSAYVQYPIEIEGQVLYLTIEIGSQDMVDILEFLQPTSSIDIMPFFSLAPLGNVGRHFIKGARTYMSFTRRAEKLGNDYAAYLRKIEQVGVTGAKSGPHGTPDKRAAQWLKRLANSDKTILPEFRDALKKAARRLEKRGNADNHKQSR
ncbi:MAG: LamG-like jellyroll fold domain-containing protein [Bacteroidota bacterium]